MATVTNVTPVQPKTIRFVNNQGQPPQKRRRINAACLTCRKRKTRCAGEHPECSTCVKNGHKCLGYTDLPEPPRKRESVSGVDLDEAAVDHQDSDHLEDETSGSHRHGKQPRNDITRHDTEGSFASSRRLSESAHQTGASLVRLKSETVDWEEQQSYTRDGPSKPTSGPTKPRHSSFSTKDGRSPSVLSPALQHNHNHNESLRVPYFRYFGPTAIVPGFKQMVVKVHDRRRSSMSATSPGSGMSFPSLKSIPSEHDYDHLDDVPVYDPHDPSPVHPLIMDLVQAFFSHLGCNYPFLKEGKFTKLVGEKRIEPILVDAVCALAARFSDSPILNRASTRKPSKADNGQVFAQRAKSATVDTFPCPSVAAVQACLLMAYEGFGADQDSALWMYLGIAIRMAVDLGLHKKDGVKYQGEKDAWYTRAYNRKPSDHDHDHDVHQSKLTDEDTLSLQEQKELEQERIDTLWTVFMLDRVISSGTGRPVTLRDNDFELDLPRTRLTFADDQPDPFPALIQIISLYGRASDVLNEVVKASDLTDERMNKLFLLEHELTRLHQKQHANLRFDAVHFQAYVQKQQGTTFILLHLWFHAMIIVLHQPALLAPLIQFDQGRELGSQSREISMSSAKTIADILAFANLIDPKSFIGNPFTSQPIYIAACAFLVESEKTNASQPASRNPSPPQEQGMWAPPKPLGPKNGATTDLRSSKRHFLLASAANQNYQACYKALQTMHTYWGGVRYILTALDQKSEGIWDCETYTREEYESARLPRRGSSIQRFIAAKAEQRYASPTPVPPPVAWSLTGTTNSPNTSMTLLYPPNSSSANSIPAGSSAQPPQPPAKASTPPGNMIYDPIRQSLPEVSHMYSPAYPQQNTSALRHSMNQHQAYTRRIPGAAGVTAPGRSLLQFDGMAPDDTRNTPTTPDSTSFQISLPSQPYASSFTSSSYPSSAHPSCGHEASNYQTGASPTSTMTELNFTQSHNGTGATSSNASVTGFTSDNGPSNFAQNGLAASGYTYLESTGQGLDLLLVENQADYAPAIESFETTEMIGWFGDYIPNGVLDLYDGVGSSMEHQQ